MDNDQQSKNQPNPSQVTIDSDAPSGPALELKPIKEMPAWARGLLALMWLYFFLCSIKIMGSGLKTVGKAGPWLSDMLSWGDKNPILALFASVLITAIVQSSSFTTSLIITLVAAGQLNVETAVYCVMGANIGTSVTGILVSLGNVRIKRQFRRAFTAALVHDIFNWLTVALLLPLEWITSAMSSDGHGVITKSSIWIASSMGLEEMEKPTNPISFITGPVKNFFEYGLNPLFEGQMNQGLAVAIAGFILLFLSLIMLVRNLKGALLTRIEGLFRKVFFRNDLMAYTVGTVTTVMVQSSSVSTSLIIPLAGAGAVKLRRVFPFVLGANLGTTVTGVIAASANPVEAAVAVAISHVAFNLIGTAVWYPLRMVPIGIARWYGKLAAESAKFAIFFLLFVFLIFPLVGIGIVQLFLSFG